MGRIKTFNNRIAKSFGLEGSEWNKIDQANKKFVRETGINLNRAEFMRMFLMKNIKEYLTKKASKTQIDLEDLI